MSKINEQELHILFEKLKEEDKTAYEELYEKYSSLVYKIAFSILKNKENAEDIMQNVFIKIGNLSKEKLPSNYEASWLYSVTKNEAISYLRKNKDTLQIDEIEEKSKEDTIEEVVGKSTYQNIISSLEQKEKQIILLKVEIGLSFKEIAKLLNMPIGTVQWKYYKSLHSLKLLIGNLSLFVVTATICVSKLLGSKKRSANMAQSEEIEVNTIIDSTTSSSISDNDRLDSEAIEQQPSKGEKENQELDSNFNNKNEIEQNKVQYENEQEIQQEVVQSQVGQEAFVLGKPLETWLDIALIGITSISLCATIFFSIIFAQQKYKKSL